MSKQSMLTTIDNPFDPFDQFDQWFVFDVTNHHHCCELLGQIAQTSNDLSESFNTMEIDRAIDAIVKEDVLNIYKKVTKEVEDD